MGKGRWWRWAMASVLVLMMSVSAPEVVHAEDVLDTVREANGHYDAGEFREALRLYRNAYDGLDDSRLLYRIGLSYEHIGNYQRAREYLEQYLRADPDSPVLGRVEANISQLKELERNIQSFLVVESEPAGAEVFLYGYMGEAEGEAPLTIPVAAGPNLVTLVFPQGQRLEMTVEVEAGTTEERFFSVGTATRPSAAVVESEPEDEADPESEEVASIEEVPLEPSEERVEDPEGESEPSEGEEVAKAEEEDVIPMPGSEPEEARPIQLDDVNIGPPWWASTLATIGIVGGNLLFLSALYVAVGANFDDPPNPDDYPSGPGAVIMGAVGVTSGFYLLGRGWDKRLPAAISRGSTGGGSASAGSGFMLRWSTTF